MRVPLVYTVHDLYPLDDRENFPEQAGANAGAP